MLNGSFVAAPTTTILADQQTATVKLDDGTKVKLFSEEAAELYLQITVRVP